MQACPRTASNGTVFGCSASVPGVGADRTGKAAALVGMGARRKLLNDAPVFLQALDHGQTVLTRNSADFDALNQMVPEGRILLYSQSR